MVRMKVPSDAVSSHANVLATVLANPGKKQKRTQHRGVLLLSPSGLNVSWRVRFRDPQTGKNRVQNIPPADAKTSDTRTAYARKLHQGLRRQKEDISSGAQPHRQAGKAIADTLALYFSDAHTDEATQRVYRDACDQLLEWLSDEGVTVLRGLTKPVLRKWRTEIKKQKSRRPPYLQLSTSSVNRMLRGVSAVLNWLRKLDHIRLSRDEIADALERYEAKTELKPFLQPEQIKQLLAACKAHDADTFKITRDKRQHKERYTAIHDFALFVLLTGVRVDAALNILRSDCTPGRINVRAEISKTPALVDTNVSPMLQDLLKRLPKEGRLFPELTYDTCESTRKRLKRFGAPKGWSWQGLRRTCGTYLTCSPGIWGGASVFMTAKQLGHSVQVAQKSYYGRVDVDQKAKTLEQAMGI